MAIYYQLPINEMIMNMSIEKMLSHVYEIEGLMLVTRRLGEENTPKVITDKIQRKVRELAVMCDVTLPVAETAAPATPAEPIKTAEAAVEAKPDEPEKADEPAETDNRVEVAAPAEVAAPVDTVVTDEGLPDKDYDADETWQHDNGEEFKEVFELDYVEPEQEATTPPPFHAPMDAEPVPEPDPDVLPEADDGPDIEVEFIEADDESVPETEDEMPTPPVPTEFPEPEESASTLRVDEKLQRNLSKDIRKAFSINDRFRFQRELFAGSANAMNTAIEHIEVMNSYGNAELYFYSQLNWDRENEVVQDFMTIVRNHFQ